MSYPPSEIASADQHFAQVAHDLDQIVDGYRRQLADSAVDRTMAIDDALGMLCEPTNLDGTDVSPDVHIGTLANLLAVAIDRLAANGGAQ